MKTSFQTHPLTNTLVETTDSAYLIDEMFAGERLIISFAFVDWNGSPQFDFYGRTKKLELLLRQPINRILLRDPSNSWYHRGVPGLGEDVDAVVAALQQMIADIAPSQVITIGQSMGAYAAIMFGQLLQVDTVIAFGSLSFLDSQRALAIQDHRWLPVMQQLEADPPSVCYFDLVDLCERSPHKPNIHYFYGRKPDPETPGATNLDEIHAQRFNQLSNCTIYPFEDSGHAVVYYLAKERLLDDLLVRVLG
jgi:hypothetical protein